jgi:hypothetical protein
MMLAKGLGAWVGVAPVFFACAWGGGPAASKPDTEFFPMTKGTYWIYQGEAAWGEADADRAKVEWKSEVRESAVRGRFKVALLLGHPWDLPWYAPDRTARGCYLLIAENDKRFYLSRRPECNIPDGEPDGKATAIESLVLVLPIRAGDVFGGDSERGDRTDGMYAWAVESIETTKLDGVKGVAPVVSRPAYTLAYRTGPDHEFVTYVPGIGLTSFVYGHHGTVSEVDVTLVEFHAGSGK